MVDVSRGVILEYNSTKRFLNVIRQKVERPDVVQIETLMNNLTTLKYHGNCTVRDHILWMIDALLNLNHFD